MLDIMGRGVGAEFGEGKIHKAIGKSKAIQHGGRAPTKLGWQDLHLWGKEHIEASGGKGMHNLVAYGLFPFHLAPYGYEAGGLAVPTWRHDLVTNMKVGGRPTIGMVFGVNPRVGHGGYKDKTVV